MIMLEKILIPKRIFEYVFNRIILFYKGVIYGKGLKIRGKLLLRGKGKIIIGNDVVINSHYAENPIGGDKTVFQVMNGAELKIGNRVGISHAKIAVYKRVEIEDDVLLGADCHIYDTDFHSLLYEDRILKEDNNIKSDPVKIKKGAFIGAGSYILKGVVIGEKSVVGAGAVVTRNVPDGEIWAGNPARKIRNLNDGQEFYENCSNK